MGFHEAAVHAARSGQAGCYAGSDVVACRSDEYKKENHIFNFHQGELHSALVAKYQLTWK